MEKIRIGNDIEIRWKVFTSDEDAGTLSPYDLTGRALEVSLLSDFGESLVDFRTESNEVIAIYRGKDQKALGLYSIILRENKGADGMKTVDTQEAFELVPRTMDESHSEDGVVRCFHLTFESVVGSWSGTIDPILNHDAELAEAQRKKNEEGRVAAEQARQEASAKAVASANKAAENANIKAEEATNAAISANSSAEAANAAASKADNAAVTAQQKAEAASSAAEAATSAAESANSAAENAQQKAQAAQDAAVSANGAASDANSAAENAQQKAEEANVATISANNATEAANVAAGNAQQQAQAANEAAASANNAATAANAAAENAQRKADAANAAATSASGAAEAANSAAETTRQLNAGLIGLTVEDGKMYLVQNSETGTVQSATINENGMAEIVFNV